MAGRHSLRLKITAVTRATQNHYWFLVSNSLNHSTKSALQKIHNDIIISMDNSEVTALTLLDLSAAFGTVDHAALTKIDSQIGMEYLGRLKFVFLFIWKNRHQYSSDKVSYGVSQSSVLRPVLFTLYTTPLPLRNVSLWMTGS